MVTWARDFQLEVRLDLAHDFRPSRRSSIVRSQPQSQPNTWTFRPSRLITRGRRNVHPHQSRSLLALPHCDSDHKADDVDVDQFGVALQGLILWVPIEKLFMTEIGLDAASVGAMAAAYAAVVPLLEVPSGILADRWSRSWVLILACVALMFSSLIGGLSHNVITYSVVYDTVVEETGSSELYENWIGRIRAVESAAFVLSALAGGQPGVMRSRDGWQWTPPA
jgi:hypothetical protein